MTARLKGINPMNPEKIALLLIWVFIFLTITTSSNIHAADAAKSITTGTEKVDSDIDKGKLDSLLLPLDKDELKIEADLWIQELKSKVKDF